MAKGLVLLNGVNGGGPGLSRLPPPTPASAGRRGRLLAYPRLRGYTSGSPVGAGSGLAEAGRAMRVPATLCGARGGGYG